MTKLHKLIRISHDGATFLSVRRPYGARSAFGQRGFGRATEREPHNRSCPKRPEPRRARPERPDRRLAPPRSAGSRKRRTGREWREASNPAEAMPFRPASAARAVRSVRTEPKRPRSKYLRFFNKKALRARSGIRRFRIISYLRSRNRRPALPSATPTPPASDSYPDQRNKRSIHYMEIGRAHV